MDGNEKGTSALNTDEVAKESIRKSLLNKTVNPCFWCMIPGCTLRINCIMIGLMEIVVWVIVIIVVGTVLAAVENTLQRTSTNATGKVQFLEAPRGTPVHASTPITAPPAKKQVRKVILNSVRKSKPGSRVVLPDYSKDDDYLDDFIILGALFVGASITAGLSLLVGVFYRAKLFCLVHSGIVLLMIVLLLVLIILEIVAGSCYTLVSSIILLFPYAYFGICSYGLYTQIREGTDFQIMRKRASVGISKPIQDGTRPATEEPSIAQPRVSPRVSPKLSPRASFTTE